MKLRIFPVLAEEEKSARKSDKRGKVKYPFGHFIAMEMDKREEESLLPLQSRRGGGSWLFQLWREEGDDAESAGGKLGDISFSDG